MEPRLKNVRVTTWLVESGGGA